VVHRFLTGPAPPRRRAGGQGGPAAARVSQEAIASFVAQAGWPQEQWPDISARWLAQCGLQYGLFVCAWHMQGGC
jgi:hypothetical protein